MAKLNLNQKIVKEAVCPANQKKLNLFDQGSSHLLLEVRPNGGKTYYIRYRNHYGRIKQYKIGDGNVISLAQARTLAKNRMAEITMGSDPLAERELVRQIPTFKNFIEERYIPFIRGYKKSSATDESYLRNHLLPCFGKKHLDEISKRDVIAFHHGLKTKGYAIGTCNRMLVLLRYALNLAVRWDIPGLKNNPTKDVPLFENHDHKERYLTQDEARSLFEAVRKSQNPILQYIVPFLVLTGARKREVLDAQWKDFDMEQKQWRVPTTKTGRPRYIPLSDGALVVLRSIPKKKGVPYVFANPATNLPFVSIFNSWDTAREAAGLKDVRMHDLRHSYASFLVNAGRSLYEVQKILGHTQIRTTQRYSHLSQDTLLDATNTVSGILNDFITPSEPPSASLLSFF